MSSLAKSLSDTSLLVEKSYINGQWVASQSGQTFEVRNPATDELLGTCPECTTDDLQLAIDAAAAAFPSWRAQTGRARARILRKLFDLLVSHKADIGRIVTAENGKPAADGEGEALFSASFFEWFAEEAPRIYGDVVPHAAPGHRTTILKQPVGVCGLITPWNFPMAMAARKIAAALAAGCTVVLKSDGVTPFSGNALAVLAEKAGVPPGVLNVVTALHNTPQLGLAMCESETIRKVSFTGSTRVGQLLMKQCAGSLKKLSLELGGNAPFIVFDDADVETAVAAAVGAKFKNTGQTCVCANRIYVQNGIYDTFSKKLVEAVGKLKVGDGVKENAESNGITHGPLTTAGGVAKVEEHVQDATSKGAKVLHGGNRLPSVGSQFFELTVLGGVDDSMRVMEEETFGPVAALSRFTSEEEVVKRANSSKVGLASYVMTTNLGTYYRVAEQLEFGMVAFNTGVISDAGAP